jgi:hypothetical protein
MVLDFQYPELVNRRMSPEMLRTGIVMAERIPIHHSLPDLSDEKQPLKLIMK